MTEARARPLTNSAPCGTWQRPGRRASPPGRPSPRTQSPRQPLVHIEFPSISDITAPLVAAFCLLGNMSQRCAARKHMTCTTGPAETAGCYPHNTRVSSKPSETPSPPPPARSSGRPSRSFPDPSLYSWPGELRQPPDRRGWRSYLGDRARSQYGRPTAGHAPQEHSISRPRPARWPPLSPTPDWS